MASYKTFYKRKCISPLFWEEIGENYDLGFEAKIDSKDEL